MPRQPTPSTSWRGPVPLAVGGCALLALCAAVALAAGAGGWVLRQPRGTESASRPAVEYIVDASPRMGLTAAGGDQSRMAVARSVLAEVVRPADPQAAAGLRVFGTGGAAVACEDTNLLVPLAPGSQPQIVDQLSALEASPAAEAALAQALLSAIHDLSSTAGPHALVVITGGADTCSAEAGQLVAAEAEEAGVDLHIFLIGYQVAAGDAEALRNLVAETGRGTYFEAADEARLLELLKAIQDHLNDPATTDRDDVLATVTQIAQQAGTPTAVAQVTATSAAATGTPTQAAAATYESQTACDHPYFPLRPGASWAYASGSGARTLTVTGVSGGANAATATVVREDGEAVEWHCTADGVWSYLLIIAAFGLDGETRGELTANSGAWLVPAERLVPGAAWTFFFRLEPSAATGNVIVGFWEFTQALTVAGVESVPLGDETVDALRVDATYEFAGEGAQTVSGRESYWFVEGVGLARLEHVAEQLQDTFVLQDYQVP